MTEYTTSSEAIREYMTAHERTAHWVHSHTRHGTDDILLSPSVPPSILSDSDAPSFGPGDSDAGSNHSTPPRMFLRYDDGRPDIPISHESSRSHSRSRSRSGHTSSSPHGRHPSQHSSHHSRSKSGSQSHGIPIQHARHAAVPLEVPHSPPHIPPPRSPESIVILPSRESGDSEQSPPPSAPHTASYRHPSANGHSRSPTTQTVRNPHYAADAVPSHHEPTPAIVSPSPRHAYNPSHASARRPRSPPVMYSQSQPLPMSTSGGARFLEQQAAAQANMGGQLPYNYSPPAIIYAPSAKHSRSRYAPPAIVYSPPSHSSQSRPMAMNGPYPAPPSMAHSHSAPLPRGMYGSRAVPPPPHHSVQMHHSHHTSSVIHEEPREASRSRSRSHGRSHDYRSRDGHHSVRARSNGGSHFVERSNSRSPSASRSGSEVGSESSTGTYYILPTPGQKVQIIVPNARSVYTATSTTKSAHSPQSAHSSGLKKPFFQRIFHIPRFNTPSVDSRGSAASKSSSGRRLQRRHTIGQHMHGRPRR